MAERHDPEDIVAHLNETHGYTIPTDRRLPSWQLNTLRNEHDNKHPEGKAALMGVAMTRNWGILPAAKVALYRALLLAPPERLSDNELTLMTTLAGDHTIQSVLEQARQDADNYRRALKDAETEPLENLEAAARIFDSVAAGNCQSCDGPMTSDGTCENGCRQMPGQVNG